MKTQLIRASFVTTATILVTLSLIMIIASGCGEDEATTTSETLATTKPVKESESTGAAAPDDHAIGIDEFICPYTENDGALTPGMITAYLLVEVENNSGSDFVFGPADFTLESESGESFSAVTDYDVDNAINSDITVAAGASASGVLLFDIPDDIMVVNLVDQSSAQTLTVELPRPTE
jgi:hypothetical protein